MITIFNRKELLITTDMEYQAEVIGKLEAAGIDYLRKAQSLFGESRGVSVVGRGNPGASDLGTMDIREKYTYTIFVHKDDLEKARGVL